MRELIEDVWWGQMAAVRDRLNERRDGRISEKY
jgi:hypothetical protein